MKDESLLAEIRRNRNGGLDGRTRPYRFRDRLLSEHRANIPIKDNQKKLDSFFKK